MKYENIFSAFDGASCGQIALNCANIKYNNYFSSEIDKIAIKVTQHNYPNTIQLGDITKIKHFDIDLPKIDLLIGGSPCQSFSKAGNMEGFDGKSGLFWEYARLKKELNPTYFLLENVTMKKGWAQIISNELGVGPIEIDSALVSAQNRKRLYWTNIPNVTQPEDRKIYLADILESNVDGRKVIFNELGECSFPAKNGKMVNLNNKHEFPYTIYEARTEFGKSERKRLRELLGRDTTPRNKEHKQYLPLKFKKANCLLTSETELDYILDSNLNYRTYTIGELEKLQTLPKGYMDIGLTKPQIRKLIGNGWTVDIIAHILKFLP